MRRKCKKMQVATRVLETDVLVVGTGIAGCFAAMRAKELNADVMMVEQGKSGFWGMSVGGTHRYRILHPDDDFDTVVKGTVMESEYMIDQDYLEVALTETWDRFQDLLKLGATFRRDDKGEIAWIFDDTDYPWYKQRQAVWEPMSSFKHLLKIKTELVRRGVKVLDRIFVSDLITRDNKVEGAVGFNTRKGDFFVFKAKAVVIATGSFADGGPMNRPHMTGDGIAMGARSGAELRGMEFANAGTAGIAPPPGGPVWVYALGSPDKGVTITNARGEEFLEQYELGRRLPGRRYFGPPWHVQLMAVLKEIQEGRGPCYVDYRAANKASRLRESYGSIYDSTLKIIELTGTTLDKIKYELAIFRGLMGPGGIRINMYGESSLPGLYAAGIASDQCCAAQYSYLSGFPGSIITGRRSGESAANFALSQPQPTVDEEQVALLKRAIYAPLDRRQGLTTDDLRMSIRDTWLYVDIRTETNLKKAHEEFQNFGLSDLVAEDLHELTKCHKIRNYLECSDAVALAALARRETRLEHIRQDYPLTDNKEWLKWVIVRRSEDGLGAYLEDIPVEGWKYKPEPTVFNRLRLKEEG
jgi:succinate dehydrogenase/fumarate reductase flavoprotein subunit